MTRAPESVVTFRPRNNASLALLVLALALGVSAYVLVGIGISRTLPANWPYVAAIWAAMGVAAHLVCRFRLPYADPVLLPVVMALTGLGLTMIHRIDVINEPPRHDATTQLIWVGLGIVAMAVTVLVVHDHRVVQGYPYLLFLAGLVLLLLPMSPLGVEINGSRIWIRLAGYSFQPAEVAKVLLAVAFAAYLAEKKDVLALAGPTVLGFTLPRPRDLGPIAVVWAASMVVLVSQRDLGTSLLFFGLFVMMIYVATERVSWVALGLSAFAVGAYVAYGLFRHVRTRVSSWLDPFSSWDENYQVIQGQFGMAWGGLFGTGLGQGRPGLVPLAKSDFMPAAIGEELGIVGLMAVVLAYGIVVARGLRTALVLQDPFGKLLAAGLSFVFALQVFSIIGGVTRLLPLTGLTTPFMSQGGSSMVANWIMLALMLVLSHQARRPALRPVDDDVADLDTYATQVIAAPVSAARPEPSRRRRPRWPGRSTASSPADADGPADGPGVAQRAVAADPGADEATQLVPSPAAADAPTQAVPAGAPDAATRPAPTADAPTELVASPPAAAPDAPTEHVPAPAGAPDAPTVHVWTTPASPDAATQPVAAPVVPPPGAGSPATPVRPPRPAAPTPPEEPA